MEGSAIIKLEHVKAGYGDTVVLDDVSFEVARGEIFILLGGSGCGKTTVMKHMIGLNPVLGGSLTIDGMEWTDDNRAELCRRIGVMFQSGALFGSMTCLENILLPLEEFSGLKAAARREKAMALLSSVELADAAGKMPSEISGGMRKRVAIARAMALDPDVVFLDEPGAGLDPITASSLDELVLRLRREKGTTFVIVTHELASVFKTGDRAAMFDRARRAMVAIGPPAELAKRVDDDFIRRFFSRGG
ncbi:MAG: ATP-binding cassette domain-containing protein [Kiritimatiellae bacterium]|nr:ATP-binding cassette domain-containing protein [Kiritimatiellia bacterium]